MTETDPMVATRQSPRQSSTHDWGLGLLGLSAGIMLSVGYAEVFYGAHVVMIGLFAGLMEVVAVFLMRKPHL